MQGQDQKKFNAFKVASLADWEVAAREELKGADPWKKLSVPMPDCTILPFYTQKDTNRPAPLIQVAENNFLGPRTWYNCPAVLVENENKSNALALDHLRNGADGIFFELDRETDFKSLLQHIDLKYCSLIFLAKTNSSALAEGLQGYLSSGKQSGENLPLVFFGNDLIPSSSFFSGLQIPPMVSAGEEIAACFRLVTKQDALACSIQLGTDFFLNVAKLRAIRITWKRFLAHKNLPDHLPCYLHARSVRWDKKEFEPHGNMLQSTTAAMAAILGGCDALTLEPEDDQSLAIRVARNVSNVLREESHFSKVADPMAGSYFVESLSTQLADAAWKSITA